MPVADERGSDDLQPGHPTRALSDASRRRNTAAERRDREADARDAAAAAHQALAAALDAGPDDMATAASRQRAAEQRARAAADRDHALRDRLLAAEDRAHATEELAAEGIDHLTGTLRRGAGFAAMQREADRTARTGETLVLAFVDVDGLKAINDSRGHAAGDEVLRDVARCVMDGLRPYDIVCRYGGDEFVCSLAGEKPIGIRPRFAQIAARITQSAHGASISVGLAEWTPAESVADTIARADLAMLAVRDHRLGRSPE